MDTNTDKSKVLNKKSVWQHVLPDFPITDTTFQAPDYPPLSPEKIEELKRAFKEEGVFQIDAIIPAKQAEKLAQGIRTLRNKGIHQVFAFLYDDYWIALKQLTPILKSILGKEMMLMPDIWAWIVGKGSKYAGWPIHRDLKNLHLAKDGTPNIFTLWIPLVDVGPTNSCMYVVPADLDPHYPNDLSNYTFKPENCRALPAPAGSAIIWGANILHWGSRSSRYAKTERISYAFYFQREGEALNHPIIHLDQPFPFDSRLRYVATQILDYAREPFAPFIYDWAKSIRFDKKEASETMY